MNFYPFHIGDYLSHTNHLSNEEDLAYRRMIDIYYQSEQPFNDRSTLARRIRTSVEIVDVILNEFFVLEDDGCWHNKRVDEEIAKYHDKLDQASRAGKASAEARLNKRSTTVQPTKNQEPITKNHIYTDSFEKFWSEYPNKSGKGGAFNSWKKIKVDDELLQKIIKSINLYKQTKQVKDGYIKNPQTWLNNRCWEDEISAPSSNDDSSRFGNIFAPVVQP